MKLNILLSNSPIWPDQGLGIVRMIMGGMMIFHGAEIFQPDIMKGYLTWDMFNNSNGKLLVYFGKSTEFLAGLLIGLGLFTRLGSLLAIGTMTVITFFVGHGKFWYEDQHPFMFVLLGAIFFFCGSGGWSMDEWIGMKRGR